MVARNRAPKDFAEAINNVAKVMGSVYVIEDQTWVRKRARRVV